MCIRDSVNGSQITTFTSATYPNQNTDWAVNNTGEHRIGAFKDKTDPTVFYPFSGYLADVHFIDGQALDPTSFGEFDDNGVWQPIEYTGSYGTNGFYLDFADNSSAAALGYDAAGSNDWTVNNISVTAGAGNDSLRDSPTNGNTADDTGAGGEVPGNYATLNPLQKSSGSTLSNGNLDISMSSAQGTTFATMAFPASGKWYFECTANATECSIGIAKADASLSEYLGNNSSGYGYYKDGNVYNNNSSAGSGAAYTTGDVIGVAFDADAGTCKWYKNNSLQVTISSLSGEWFPAFGSGSAAGILNFGSRPFAYSAPSNHKALCTANLPTPTIADGSTAVGVVTYTGTGVTNNITSLEFSPDLVWIKQRSHAGGHYLYDIIRGANKPLYSHSSALEGSASNQLMSFDSNGFTVEASDVNTLNRTHVAWCWDAGSSTVTNTDGSITSSVRANPTAGFSIATYNGQSTTGTVGHGLGAEPHMIMVKNRTGTADDWFVYHKTLGNTKRIRLNLTAAADTYSVWNNTSPTSTVFTVQTGWNTSNNNGNTHVAYCFAPVEGYSAFGSADGGNPSFVYTGFRPRYLMLKRTDSTSNWHIFDTARSTYNASTLQLYANNSLEEEDQPLDAIDFVSNGFVMRSTNSFSSAPWVYCAFAEHPFKTARAR